MTNQSPVSLGESIMMLVERAARRRQALDEVTKIQQDALEHHATERARAKALHQAANRELIDAVDTAKTSGMTLVDIAKTVGLSPPALVKLTRTVKEWGTTQNGGM
jgi:hypothetical protein